MEPTLKWTQILKEEAEDIGLMRKEVAEYVREQQTLDREERAAWRDSQKRFPGRDKNGIITSGR